MGAEKLRIYAAMLDSLRASFRMADGTGQLIVSMNAGDIADMLTELKCDLDQRLRVTAVT